MVRIVDEDAKEGGGFVTGVRNQLGLDVDHEGGDHCGEQADLRPRLARARVGPTKGAGTHNHEDKIQVVVEPLYSLLIPFLPGFRIRSQQNGMSVMRLEPHFASFRSSASVKRLDIAPLRFKQRVRQSEFRR